MKSFSICQYIFWILAILLVGLLIGFVTYNALLKTIQYFWGTEDMLNQKQSIVERGVSQKTIFDLKPISYNKFIPPKSGKLIYVDTYFKLLMLYDGGKMVDSYKIKSLGSTTSSSMLVAGDYKVVAKETNHRSALLNLSFPNSVAFSGNYFIHGTPLDRDGQPVFDVPYSIELDDHDAESTFVFAATSTRVRVSAPITTNQLTSRDKEFLGLSSPFLDNDFNKLDLPVKAKAFQVKDLESDINVINRGVEKKFPIASLTKLITAMVAADTLRPDDIIQMSKSSVSTLGHQGGLSVGEKFKLVDLLNCLLLESSNDAAEALAEKIGRNKFIALMNDKAKEVGMLHTKFVDPSGLSVSNISTSEDMSKLIEYVEKNRQDILSITTRTSYRVLGGNMSRDHLWLNRNRLVRENNRYYVGGKDGFTSDALMTFIGVFSVPLTEFDHKRFSVAILKSSDRNGDVDKILNKIIASLRYVTGDSFEMIIQKRMNEKGAIEFEKNLSIMFVGDIMLDRGVKQMINTHGGGDYSFPFEYVPFLKDPDILFGNLEGPASDLGYDIGSKYSFRMDPKAVTALAKVGFDALSVANNHAGDWGLSAFEDTLNRLRTSGIKAVGGGYNGVDARTVKIIEKSGIKIGFLGFSDVGPAWMTEKNNLPTILSAGDANYEKIINEASKKVDHLIVSIHFGEEYLSEATERQRRLARTAIDAGAKIVVGHHPHVPEEVEKYNGGVIAYSLGNFIFDQHFSEETMTGGILEIILDKKNLLEVNESKAVQNLYFQPVLNDEAGQ